MKLHQLFESFKDHEVPVEIRHDFRRLMLDLTRWFPVKQFEHKTFAGEKTPSPYYLQAFDHANNEVSVNLDVDSLQRWSIEINYINYIGDEEFFSKAKAKQLYQHLKKEFDDVDSYHTNRGGSFMVVLGTKARR